MLLKSLLYSLLGNLGLYEAADEALSCARGLSFLEDFKFILLRFSMASSLVLIVANKSNQEKNEYFRTDTV